jgi:Spy/CpxP family protein refolding chaperone
VSNSSRRLFAVWLAGLLVLPVGLAVETAAQEPATDAGTAPASTPDAAGRRADRLARRGGGAGNPDVMTVQQVEEYFDQVMLHQARTNLALTDDQFLRFGAGLRRLQTARRQQQRQRVAMMRELNMLVNATPFDEAAATSKLKELDDFSARSTDEIRSAYDAIDRSLTLRQRARFRIFEEMMERRKLDLVSRARQQASRPADAAR